MVIPYGFLLNTQTRRLAPTNCLDMGWETLFMKSFFLCLTSAILLGFAQPYYMPDLFGEVSSFQNYLGILALVGYAPLFLALADKSLKQTFWWAFFSLSVQYTIVLYWMYIALTVHGHIAPVLSGLITLMLPFLLALKISLFLTMGRFLSQRFSLSFLWIAPIALCAGEYFRNFYIFGGFPWGNAGYAIGQIDPFLQAASLVGVYGLVFVVGLINALIAHALKKHAWRYGVCAAAIVLALYTYGAMRLFYGSDQFAPSIRVALLQGNIEQEVKRKARLYSEDIIAIYQHLHEQARQQGAELIVWPESAYPLVLPEESKDLGLLFAHNAGTILGAVALGRPEDGSAHHVRNSAFILDYRGAVVKRYDKSHLVPFGEYVPWPMTNIVDKIVPGMGAFLPGLDYDVVPLTLDVGKTVKVGTTICYEGIFPEISRAYAHNGAQLLVNITNDAWYGLSSAPYQHLHMYRLRSAETGLSFVRATNSGISAVIDPFGRVKKSLPLFERAMLIDDVAMLRVPTLYAAVGDVIAVVCLLLMVISYVLALVPIHRFIRHKEYKKLALIVGLASIVGASHIYFNNPAFMTDESARTKSFVILLMAFLLMLGCLVRTARSKAILSVCGVIITAVSLALVFIESAYFLLGLALGLLIYGLAFSIKTPEAKGNR